MNSAETQARQSLKRLRDSLQAAFRAPGKEKSIHDLRVTIRRFKQVLRVYREQFEKTRKMRRELSGLMEECGAARNCDIAETVLEAAGVPADRALKRDLKKRRAAATRKLGRDLKEWQDRARMQRWSQWLKPGPEGKAAPDLKPSRPAAPALSRDFLKSGAAAASATAGVHQMHEFRLMVKKTRYAAEILGAPAAQITSLRGLQDCLGAINDCVTTSDLIADLKLEAAQQRRIKTSVNRLAGKRIAEFRVYWRTHFAGRRTK